MKKCKHAVACHIPTPLLKFLLLMKLSFVLVFVTCLQVAGRGYSQDNFNLHYKQVAVSKILNTMQAESKYRFFYNNGYMDQLGKVDIEVDNASLEQVLRILLGKQLNYTITNQNKVIISPVGVDNNLIEQADGPLKGKIMDEDGKPLGNVTIKLKGSATAVTTNDKGEFSLDAPDDAVLEISYVGYKTQTLSAKGQKFLQVFLQPSANGMNEVVVVGYGTQRKRDVTGSVSTVKGDEIKNLPVSNAADALQGRATGVDIVRDDGSPGSNPSIRIRGTGTINNSDPLVVIDGVPSGGLNDVNPNDIASIDILKDASASAIYGSRAANGVVLITTKKGRYGEGVKTNVNLYAGQEKPVKFIDMLQAPDLVNLKKEAYTNDGIPVPIIWNDPKYAVQRTDWQRALMTSGNIQNADAAVRGGNATSNYSFSGNYFNNTGMIPNAFFRRYSFNVNSEHKIGSHLRVGETILYSGTNGVSPNTKSSQTGLVWSAIRFNPAIPVRNSDGSWGSSQADNQLGDINNPVATASETDAYKTNDRILANAYVEVDIVKGLKFRANYGYDHSSGDSYNFNIAMPGQTRGPSISNVDRRFEKNTTLLEEYFLTYNALFNDVHSLTLTGGYSAQAYSGNYFTASRSGYADTSHDQRVLDLGNLSSSSNTGANNKNSGLQSYFVRANYAFEGKYLFTATFRADASSKFAPGQRWGYFPAFSAGWRVSDEKFFKDNIKAISTLKFTGGWGQLGNQNIGDFQYLSIISLGGGSNYGYNLGSTTTNNNGSAVTSLANLNITWERAVMTNISMELGFLDNHLNAVVTYYNKNTSKMLIPYQLVETFGAQTNLPDDGGNITLPDYNLGELNNHGVEIELNYQNKAGKLDYSLGVNGTFNSNKVTKLYGSSTYIGSTPYGRENTDISRTYEGQPIASFYGFKANGLYQNQAEIDNDPNIANDPNKANIKPGDVKFLDVSSKTKGTKDGIIDDHDRVNLGNPNPKFVYGFHGSLGFQHFDLNFNFVGATGFQLYNADRLAGLDATQVYNWYGEQKGRWHGEGTSNSIPRLSIDNLNANYRSSSLWVQNGAYMSLKSLSIGYTIHKIKISDVVLPEARFYLTAYNLFMITGYKGYSPELGYTNPSTTPPNMPNSQRGVDLAQYPAARSLLVGISLNL